VRGGGLCWKKKEKHKWGRHKKREGKTKTTEEDEKKEKCGQGGGGGTVREGFQKAKKGNPSHPC